MRPPGWEAVSVDDAIAGALASQLKVRPLTARILLGRGLGEAAVAAKFLAPRLADLRPPEGMADLAKALDRLVAALAAGETLGVFGDYDVDGVTTAAVLASALRALGGRVVARCASRDAGYGLGVQDVERFDADGCRVLVTGDLGTSDHEALRAARGRGLDVIVIDHHQLPEGESEAFALINPRRPDDAFPFKGLASCGVAFYLAAALRTRLRDRFPAFDPRELLDLVALGTIADIVPLVDENRVLVAHGLRVLGARKRPAIAALAAKAELAEGAITAHDVGFRLAPRLNSAGRMGEAQLALDLLLAPDAATAARLVEELEDRNAQRQRIQELVWTEALVDAAELEAEAAIVVGRDGWHPGVVGIVAARLVDRYARPVVVVGFRGEEGRGSARTVPGFDLFAALSRASAPLSRFGGHAAAAGMSVSPGNLDAFRRLFVAAIREQATGGPRPAMRVDAVVELGDLDVPFAEELARLQPFGAANAEPLFAVRGVTTQATRRVGQGHLQLTLMDGGAIAEAIAFGMADRDPGTGAAVDLLATAELDTFRGARRARLKVRHLFPHGQAAAAIPD
ncbi:MAG TPA: single-stranded-DNA-specific exonuclease RecJ [Polyangia bacterium]|nr:single-stranded-DNA-specific exonuclease RecJ [Polyangia bacterium]